MKCYHLKTSRVKGHNEDGTSNIERITVKLVTESSLIKYVKFMLVNGYVKNQPPEVVKVLDVTRGQKIKTLGKKDIDSSQKIVDDLLESTKMVKKIDYKASFEDQKKRSDDLERRLNAIETKSKEEYVAKKEVKNN